MPRPSVLVPCLVVAACGGGSSSDPVDARAADAADEIDAGPSPRRAFVTSTPYGSDLMSGAATGVAAADQICAADAAAFSDRTWVAWISAANVPDGRAPDRFTDPGPWYRMDDQRVADSLTALLATGPLVPITVDENGAAVGAPAPVWTATTASGTVSIYDCAAWTGGNPKEFPNAGMIGEATDLSDWSGHFEGPALGCNGGMARLYCFEQ